MNAKEARMMYDSTKSQIFEIQIEHIIKTIKASAEFGKREARLLVSASTIKDVGDWLKQNEYNILLVSSYGMDFVLEISW